MTVELITGQHIAYPKSWAKHEGDWVHVLNAAGHVASHVKAMVKNVQHDGAQKLADIFGFTREG